jgi:predicted GNAT family N-acyltransferase
VNISEAKNRYDYAMCIYIRTMVFIIGQDCPLVDEIENAEDEEQSVNFIGYLVGERAAATARYRMIDKNTAKVERVAVLDEYRGQGLGKEMVSYILDRLEKDTSVKTIKLGAQDHALEFYKKLGFVQYGDGFMEAGIPHHMMEYKKA